MSTNPQQNEAACLLEKGALYNRRRGLDWEGRDLIFAGFKPGAFSLYFGDAPIYHFDLEGRWQRAYVDDRHYIRKLDGSVVEIERVRESNGLMIQRRTLDESNAQRFDEQVRTVAETLLADLAAGQGRLLDPPADKAEPIDEGGLQDVLTRIAAWNGKVWADFESRYHRIYGPTPLIPPDCPNALILQATVGDLGGRSFAGGAADDHVVRSPDEFDRHVQDVADLLGRRLLQTRTALLAGPDVLRLPGREILAYLDIIARRLNRDEEAGPWIEDVHAFFDDFQDSSADVPTLKAAFERRLTRIALGVESGAPELRREFGKDWSDADLQAFAAAAKAAGIQLSVLALVGAGGRSRRSEHVERTRGLIESLLLTRGDFVFLMDERELAAPGSKHAIDSLDDASWNEQLELLRQGLSGLRERGVKVVPYRMAKQVS